MIIYEDAELEEAVLEGGFPVCVAFEASQAMSKTEPLLIRTYRASRGIAEEFESLFSSNPFGKQAREFLFAHFEQFYSRYGYELDRRASQPICEYVLKDLGDLSTFDRSEVFLSAKKTDFDSYPCETLHHPDDEKCAVVIQDGKIVALAGINDFSDDDSIEIYTECAVQYRRRGYAKKAVCALSENLLREGQTVSYKTYEKNLPSRRLAQSAGFLEFCRSIRAVGYFQNVED